MSTSPIHAHSSSSWKQEVNRRLAEHRGRKPAAQPETQVPAGAQQSASRRAQEAAARVAARYANAPSYSAMLAGEARAALRAAEAASEAAFHARAAAESVLAGIEAAAAAMPASELATLPQSLPLQETIAPSPRKERMDTPSNQDQPLTIVWAPELPERAAERAELRTGYGNSLFEEEWWRSASVDPVGYEAGEIEAVEPAQPIHGNLIEFPREIVAPRKVRPRLAESPAAAHAANVQLSIFEVDPLTIATEPSAESVQADTSAWSHPAWSGLELDAHTYGDVAELLDEPAPSSQPAHQLQSVAFNRHVMALFVDGTLVTGTLVGAALLALHMTTALPSLRTVEYGSIVALVVISALYLALFFTIAPATPGMMYAGIQFCTFEGFTPTRAQRLRRLAAMLLSVLPVGLGLAWALFDDDRLCWHDRLSRTYICNR